LLYYPALILIRIAEFFDNLPGNLFATGKISLGALISCYLIFLAIWLIPWLQKRWQLATLFLLIAVITPIVIHKINLNQVTILATTKEPIIIIQNLGKTTLINLEDQDTLRYSLIPFLANQGINKIDNLFVFNARENLGDNGLLNFQDIPTSKLFLMTNSLLDNIQSKGNNQNWQLDQTVSLNESKIKLIWKNPPILQLTIFQKKWLFLPENLPPTSKIKLKNVSTDILLWSGVDLNYDWLNTFQPQVAIAFRYALSSTMKRQLEQNKILIYSTKSDGAIQYHQEKGFTSYLQEYDPVSY
jgi:competence protein ComEC